MTDIDQILEIEDKISMMRARIDMLSSVTAADCAKAASHEMNFISPHHFVGGPNEKPAIEMTIGLDDFSLIVGLSGVEFWEVFDSYLEDVERTQLSAQTNAEIDIFEANWAADGSRFDWKQGFAELSHHAVAEIRALVETQFWRSDDLEQMLAEALFEAVQERIPNLRDELEELSDSLEELV